MNLVPQEIDGLCVHACYAMIVDVTLHDAIMELGSHPITVATLERVLRQKHNIRLGIVMPTERPWPEKCILVTENSVGELHCTIKVKDAIYDPIYGIMNMNDYSESYYAALYTREIRN